MKTTLKHVFEIMGSLQQVLNARELKPKVAFRLRRLAGALQVELEAFNKTRDEIKTATTGDAEKPSPEQEKAFADRLKEVMDEEVELPDIAKFYAAELAEAKLSAVDLFNLEFLLEDDYEKGK